MTVKNNEYSPIQLLILFSVRIAIGWHFLYEGIVKLLMPGWTSADYLSVSRWLFSGVFNWIVETPSVLNAVDYVNMWGLVLIGLALMLGIFTRFACWAGAALLFIYYIANPPFVGLGFGVPAEGHYLVVNKNLIEMLALVLLVVFPTGHILGLERLYARPKNEKSRSGTRAPMTIVPASNHEGRRALLKSLISLPLLGAFAYAMFRKKQWVSYEEKNLLDAVTSASAKIYNFASLNDLKGEIPPGKIGDKQFSRLILGGNLLSGWAHSRDLIYVSQLVKAYHHKDKIFATLLLAEKCGINTLLTNPILCTLINEYWKRDIGKIQFISDCVGLNYDALGKPSPAPYEEFIGRIKRAIDHGACACYIQGETADHYIRQGKIDAIAKALDLIRRNHVIAGVGAHRIETIKACADAGLDPDFWMKTLHHHDYWSAKHPEWHDNLYCYNPQETINFMKNLAQPWIAFKVLAAGAIRPEDGFRFAFENGADFVCAGMYDFQMVDDVNIALDLLDENLKRERPWMA